MIENAPIARVPDPCTVFPPGGFGTRVSARQVQHFSVANDGISSQVEAGIGRRIHDHNVFECTAVQGHAHGIAASGIDPQIVIILPILPRIGIGSGLRFQEDAIVEAENLWRGNFRLKCRHMDHFNGVPFDAFPDFNLDNHSLGCTAHCGAQCVQSFGASSTDPKGIGRVVIAQKC